MKRLPAILALFLAVNALPAQGIVFETDSWAALLAKAKSSNKLIFLDAYASWCGPCKKMSRETFTNAEVGAYYNATFVNAKIDMEKGEGPDLASRYEVGAYPTLLFIDGDGIVVHRSVGYQDAGQFLALGKTAADPTKNLGALEAAYRKGNRSPEFILAYLEAKSAVGDDVTAVATEYLSKQPDWSTDQNLDVIMQYVQDPYAEPYTYFNKEKARFVAKYGEDAVSEKAGSVFGQYLDSHEDLPLDEIEKLIGVVFPEDKDELRSMFRMRYYLQAGDVENFGKTAVEHFNRYPSDDPNELNQIAWFFYEKIDDKAQLNTALGWALRSVEMVEVYQNQDTVAALYFKLGKKDLAEKHALRAIELAREKGEDASSTEELLQKIRG
ncbi:MAG: DUF255 domain-containing protein [Saprospirales bacterium]|jgi:thiol-disulfide isomerase/thioredoxin|nr:DUF255 domain-containing protein [Saprospirales bacterium]MBK8922532.1 DUF255 domain-containing protein [Saprospirales bacterium]